jgi:hypothetical protein
MLLQVLLCKEDKRLFVFTLIRRVAAHLTI